jgi:hypothetical protein
MLDGSSSAEIYSWSGSSGADFGPLIPPLEKEINPFSVELLSFIITFIAKYNQNRTEVESWDVCFWSPST